MVSIARYDDVVIAVQVDVPGALVQQGGGLLVLVVVVLLVQVVEVFAVLALEAALDLHLAQAAQHVGAALVLPADQGGWGVDAEPVDARDVAFGALGRHQGRVHLEHDVVERGAKVGPVNSGVPRRLWVVNVLAPRAVQLDRLLVGHVRLAHGEQRVRVTKDARAFAKIGFLILVELFTRKGKKKIVSRDVFLLCLQEISKGHICPYHFGQTSGRDYVSGVNQAVQVPCRLLDGLSHVIIAVKIEYIGDEVERILIVLDLGVQAGQVEAVREVVLVDLAKVLVASRGNELMVRKGPRSV